MAKRTVYLHVGPAVPGIATPHEALRDHPALVAAGVALPAVDQEDMDRADVEIRRRHKAVGVRRKDVEGAWAKVCRKAYKPKGDVLVSQPGFLDADPDQVALAVDGLVGMRLHVIVTPDAVDDEMAPVDLVGPWAAYVKRDSRIHVLPVGDRLDGGRAGARSSRGSCSSPARPRSSASWSSSASSAAGSASG